MKCKRVRGLMGAYLYGDLEAGEMMEVRLHAQDCEECAGDLASRGQALSMLDDAAPELTDDEREQIAWSVRGAVRTACSPRGVASRWAPALAIAAALCVGLGIGAVIGSHLGNTHRSPGDHSALPKVEITEDVGASPESIREKSKRTAVRPVKSAEPAERAPKHDGPTRQTGPRLRVDPTDLFPTAISNAMPTNRSRTDSNRLLPVPVDGQPDEDAGSRAERTDGAGAESAPEASGDTVSPAHDDAPVDSDE